MNAIEIAQSVLFGPLNLKGREFDGQKLPSPEELQLMVLKKEADLLTETLRDTIEGENS